MRANPNIPIMSSQHASFHLKPGFSPVPKRLANYLYSSQQTTSTSRLALSENCVDSQYLGSTREGMASYPPLVSVKRGRRLPAWRVIMVIKDYVTILVSSMLVHGGRGNGFRTQEPMDQVLAPFKWHQSMFGLNTAYRQNTKCFTRYGKTTPHKGSVLPCGLSLRDFQLN